MNSRLVDKHRSHDEWLLGGLPDDDWPALTDEEIERRATVMKREEQRIKGNGNDPASLNRQPRHAVVD